MRIFIAVADVDALVKKGTPIDDHARHNTTSVYTAARVFAMLPEKLSTDLTSLNEGEDRVALVIEMTVHDDGTSEDGGVYRALVHNKAKLAYDRVAAWLDGEDDEPEKVRNVEGLAESLRMQDRTPDRMRDLRHEHGALDLETIEARPVIRDGQVVDLQQSKRNNARLLIEDFMIAANGATARFLAKRGLPSIRRVVRSPERWDRIERIAEELGDRLPPEPDARALEEFLRRRRKADPMRFPDLSLSIVKAMGAGEYVAEEAKDKPIGHFGLAVKDYTHSTAPNRRYPTSSRIDWSRRPWPVPSSPTTSRSWRRWPSTARRRKTRRTKSSASCAKWPPPSAPRPHRRPLRRHRHRRLAEGHRVRIFHPPIEAKSSAAGKTSTSATA